MSDTDCIELLQWALPRLGLRWRGFKNLRRQVCRRIQERARELGCTDLADYRRTLEADPEELARLDALCFVTISRFYRDRQVFDELREVLLPERAAAAEARGDHALRIWSAGCASGEEPYTVAIVWHLELASRFPSLSLELLATDFDAVVLARAVRGCYEPSSLRELPPALRDAAFETVDDEACVRAPLREGVVFAREDVRRFLPAEPQDVVLCRNVAFTYFDEPVQREMATRLAPTLVEGGILVVGAHEELPAGVVGFERHSRVPEIYVRTST